MFVIGIWFAAICAFLFAVDVNAIEINGTGASSAAKLLYGAMFTYELEFKDSITYVGDGSGVGTCNIMGFWHSGNTDPRTPALSARTADQALCSNPGLLTAGQRAMRHPLVDFSSVDALSSTLYPFFPDLQLLPAVALAVVPIYNIPELNALFPSQPLVLSRASIALIFMGYIRYWNDSRILADNSAAVRDVLTTISSPINVVVRQDSSGTTNNFAFALNLFNPSFSTEVGSGNTPSWCGSLTDEIHRISVTSCTSGQTISLRIVDPLYAPRVVTFACDATASQVAQAYSSQGGTTVLVSMTPGASSASRVYEVGHSDPLLIRLNWYQAQLLSTSTATATVSTLQEGGFLNAHYSGTKKTTLLTQSVFLPIGSSVFFDLSGVSGGITTTTNLLNSTLLPDLSTSIKNLLLASWPGSVSTVTRVKKTGASWIEYRVAFSSAVPTLTARSFPTNAVDLTQQLSSTVVYVAKFLGLNAYPRYFTGPDKTGYLSTGQYTCYKRQLGYKPFTYYTGSVTIGVIATVLRVPYSISYSVLSDAVVSSCQYASMINQAGNVVAPTATTLTFAAMEQGGNLNARLEAVISDGKSAQVWPMAGYAYFVYRKDDHIGDCERRKAAMKFLYEFYFGNVIRTMSSRLLFSPLPDFIRDIVVQRLVSTARCTSGEYALAAYLKINNPVLVPTDFSLAWLTYLDAFVGVNASLSWSMTQNRDSTALWTQFKNAPTLVTGTLTLFTSRAEKQAAYSHPNILSVAFANVAVVLLYNIPALASRGATLRVTPDILAGIFSGTIRYWNHTLIKQANAENSAYLPYSPINVVARTDNSDASALFVRYLALNSPSFCQTFGISSSYTRGPIDFSAVIPHSSFVPVTDNLQVDSSVNFIVNSIGFYLNSYVPSSPAALFCRTGDCETIIPPTHFGADCEADETSTIVSGPGYSTLDLMLSTSANCYPITGTIDYSTSIEPGQTPAEVDATRTRVQLSSWLFKPDTAVTPSATFSIMSTDPDKRKQVFSDLCDVKASGTALGYTYCAYRDCSWIDGDFSQDVSACDASSATRTVSYSVVSGSNCLTNNPLRPPPSDVTIGCTYAPHSSGFGQAGYAFLAIGFASCLIFLIFVIINRAAKVIKRSQPVFIDIFILGAILMNLSIVVFIGENTDTTCMLRPWLFDISTSIMFAPLIMKLRRVDKLVNNPKLKKIRITDFHVVLQVVALITVDVVILVLWSIIETPRAVHVDVSYSSVLADVDDVVCSTGIQSPFEIVMLVWKIILLLYGVKLAVTTWKAPPELSEAKHFAIAIYNIAVLGGITYFLGIFISTTNAGAGILLHCLGIFICSTAAVAVIILPKLLVIEGLVKPTFVPTRSSAESSGGEDNKSGSFVVPGQPKPYQPVDSEQGSAYAAPGNLMVLEHLKEEGEGDDEEGGLEETATRRDPNDDTALFTSKLPSNPSESLKSSVAAVNSNWRGSARVGPETDEKPIVVANFE